MEFLYLSPEFPPNYANFIVQLQRCGARVWALGEADFYSLPEHLRNAIRYYVRSDLTSFEAVKRSLDELLYVKTAMSTPRRFDVVESHNETWLSLEAHINGFLNIPGIRPRDLDRLKKKSVMKQVFNRCSLATARGERIRDADHGRRLADEIGYPLILKPDEGVGAGSIYTVIDPDQLARLLPMLSDDYVMEAFVDAPIISYDGLTDWDGNLLFENSLTYGDGVLDYVHGKDTFFYVDRQIPEALTKIGRDLVKAFDIRRKFFHFEFFDVGEAYWPIEINCRPPGGAILDMMNYSVDDDLYAAYARMITNRKGPRVATEKKYYCAYVGRRDRDYLYSHSDLVARLGDALVEFGENPGIFQAAMSRCRYLIRSTEREDLLTMARDAQRQKDA